LFHRGGTAGATKKKSGGGKQAGQPLGNHHRLKHNTGERRQATTGGRGGSKGAPVQRVSALMEVSGLGTKRGGGSTGKETEQLNHWEEAQNARGSLCKKRKYPPRLH